MIEAPLPPDEDDRLSTLRGMNILYTPAEDRIDRITRLACRLLNVPIALVSLVDSQCQWFKSVQGLEADDTPRAVSFCAHAILDSETLVVPNALEDPRFADNPLVAGKPLIRFYAGQPLVADDGSRLGTLCIIDREPREPSADELETLRDLGGWVASELRLSQLSEAQQQLIAERQDLQRRAMVDSLTRVWNRESILDVLDREIERAVRERGELGVILADLDHFKQINDTHGHPAGDAVLRGVAKNIRGAIRAYDAVGRYGGEEFLILLINCGDHDPAAIAERIRKRVAGEYETPAGPVGVSLSMGLLVWPATERVDAAALIAAADKALYRAKSNGRDRVEPARLDSVQDEIEADVVSG